jgi:putative endonuclease
VIKYDDGGCPPATQGELARHCGQVAQMYYTYVLRSDLDSKLYVGYSENLKRRIADHLTGKVDATKHRLPLTLVYYEACLSKEKALKREKYFKTGFGRKFLKEMLMLKNWSKTQTKKLI